MQDESRAAAELGNDEAHVWIVRMTARDPAEVKALDSLAADERATGERFRSSLDCARFLERRVALRVILAKYLQTAPRQIQFKTNGFGKPSLAEEPAQSELSFNASHSAALAAIAVGRLPCVGIDIEQLRSLPEAEEIAARFFSAQESAALARLPQNERVEAFFMAWTRKEAVVKALGGGLTIPLDSFEVSLPPREPAAILRWDVPAVPSRQLRIYHIEPAPGYVGALATSREARITLLTKL